MSINKPGIYETVISENLSENPIHGITSAQIQTSIDKKTEMLSSKNLTEMPNQRNVTSRELPPKDPTSATPLGQSLFSQTNQKLLGDYLKHTHTTHLSEKDFQNIWATVDKSAPIGKGAFGLVYASADGKYALKVAKVGNSIENDITKNETLTKNQNSFDLNQFYYRENAGFITQYMGTFTIKETAQENEAGPQVAVFEKIDGKNFSEINTPQQSVLFRLIAQGATAVAISHEAACINSDIKPDNMMVTKDLSLLKLIDQGGLIDLTQENPKISTISGAYAAPETTEYKILPASDVFSLGVTILEKVLPDDSEFSELKANILSTFLQEVVKTWSDEYITLLPDDRREEFHELKTFDLDEDYSRKSISENISEILKILNPLGNEQESQFIGELLKDCLAFEPKDRLSAAQVAEILYIFSSYLEEKEKTLATIENSQAGSLIKMGLPECPTYQDVKTMAMEDCPKTIPIALRKMLFNINPDIQQKAIGIIQDLVRGDPSYAQTPSYGMTLLLANNLKTDGAFQIWAKENSQILQDLKTRTYILGKEHKPMQDMPVSKVVFNTLNNFQ